MEGLEQSVHFSGKFVYAPVAQLDRVTDSDSVGHWFESSRAYQCVKTHSSIRVRLFLFLMFIGGV